MPGFKGQLDWMESGFGAIDYSIDELYLDYLNVIQAFPGLCSLEEWEKWDIHKHDKFMTYAKEVRGK